MKKKVLSLVLILMLVGTMFVLTGCGDENKNDNDNETVSSESVAEEIETAVNEAIKAEYEESSNFYVADIQERLPDNYTIVGVYSSSGQGISSVKEYIDPDEGLGAGQGGMSIVNTVDYLIIYDSDSNKEFRVRIFRTSTPPTASCSEDSEITK